MTEYDIQVGMITVTQNKTGAKLRISVQGELAALVQRIASHKAGHKIRSFSVIVDDNGREWQDMLYAIILTGKTASRNKKKIISVQGLIGKAATDKTEPVISDRLKTITSLKYCHD